jgi:tagatose-6-phosphate ketose/aldose isomerase
MSLNNQQNNKQCLGLEKTVLVDKGGAHTAAEITQQPEVWKEVLSLVTERREQIAQFLGPLLKQKDLRIILTGAGTSAFIGKCLAPIMVNTVQHRVEAIPTTDLVAGPGLYFQPDVPTLMVSFARSGSSPESLAAVNLANSLCNSIHHIIFTCNEEGELFLSSRSKKNVLTLLLPHKTHDRGFAMTSSFTSMLYSASLVFGLVSASQKNGQAMSLAAADVIERALPLIQTLVRRQFKRVVYLGSNELRGLAEEAALKLLELTDGQIVASYDSPLGFRHGPKTIVNDQTLVVLFLSNHAYTRQYDLDLLRELQLDGKAGQVVALSAHNDLEENANYFQITGMTEANNLELALPYIVFAQIFAFWESLTLGITPDSPSVSGTVNRVVQGVNIYPLLNEAAHVSGR